MKVGYTPAKISRPTVKNVYQRPRLFYALDRARERSVAWVQAPPGSGKTTLVGSYLDDRELPHIWYQMDEGDKDVASFFYYMKLAVQQMCPDQELNLPILMPVHLPGLRAFAKNYFKALYEFVSNELVVVIDDYHSLALDSGLQDAIVGAIEELPDHIQFIVLSRESPTDPFGDISANEGLSFLDWEDIQFSAEECLGLAELYHTGEYEDENEVHEIYEQTQGWVLGMVFLLQRDGSEATEVPVYGADKTVIFDYFAGEIFEKESDDIQSLLLTTSLLGQFNENNVEEICDQKGIGNTLAAICERNYFMHKTAHDGVLSYSYLPLFKDFLQNRLEGYFNGEDLYEIKLKAAKILLSTGNLLSAASLLTEIEAWDEFAQVIINNAEEVYFSGRYITLQLWLDRMPESEIEKDPWLMYWAAMAKQPFRPRACHDDFKKVFHSFMDHEIYDGAYLSWVMAMESITYSLSDITLIEYWQNQLDNLRLRCPEFLNPEIEARVTICILGAFAWRNFNNSAQIANWAKRAEALLDTQITTSYKITIGSSLLSYYGRWIGDLYKCCVIAERIDPLIETEEIAPMSLVVWYIAESMIFWMTARPDRSIEVTQKGMKVLGAQGAEALNPMLQMQMVYASIAKGDLEVARSYLYLAPGDPQTWDKRYTSHHYFLSSLILMEGEDFETAMEQVSLAVKHVDKNDLPLYLGFINLPFTQCLIEAKEYQIAADKLDLTRKWAISCGNQHVIFQLLLVQAQWFFDQDMVADGKKTLEKAIHIGKENHFLTHPWVGWRRASVQRLYSFALDNNIEPGYINTLIDVNKVIPTRLDIVSSAWPWFLKLESLGGFSLTLKGRKISLERFSDKERELIELIVAFGGKSVNVDMVVASLWPAEDQAFANKALTETLTAIHKNLVKNDVILLERGRLSFNDSLVWLDLWAFEKIAGSLDDALKPSGNTGDNIEGSVEKAVNTCNKLMALYKGDFLMGVCSLPPVIATHNRISDKLDKAVKKVGLYLEARSAYREASGLYEKAIVVSPLTEELYFRQMVCFDAVGDKEGVAKVYADCSTMLLDRLKTQPSDAIEQLYQRSITAS
ncbi:MAG: hypothetical protein K6L81_03020 [Agarilytica sp.]